MCVLFALYGSTSECGGGGSTWFSSEESRQMRRELFPAPVVVERASLISLLDMEDDEQQRGLVGQSASLHKGMAIEISGIRPQARKRESTTSKN